MAQAARESLEVAARTEKLARWVVLFARVVGALAALTLGLALVSLLLFLVQGRSSAVLTGAGMLVGAAVVLLVQATFLALVGRYAQLRAVDVRASRAYEAAVAAALADALRTRDPGAAAAAGTSAGAIASDAVALGPTEPAAGPGPLPHSHSHAAAQPVAAAAAVVAAEPAAAPQPAPVAPAAETATPTPEPVAQAVEPVATVEAQPAAVQTGTTQAADAAQQSVVVHPDTGLPVPGWYPDPAGPGQRWWDGTQWTTATR